MTTTRNRTIRQVVLTTIAVAGLVAGTAACSSKNSATSAEAATSEQSPAAPVLPEVDDELDIVAPELGNETPAAPETDVAPEDAAPEVVTPEEEAAPEVVTPEEETAPEESAPESGSSGGSTSPRFPGISLPSIPTLIAAPQVEGVMFWITGDTTSVDVMVNEKSPLALADIVEVKVTYSFLGEPIVDRGVQVSEVGTDVWKWTIADTVIDNDTDVTITVTNAAGKVHTYSTTATLSAPL